MDIKSDFLEGIGSKIVEYREKNKQTQNDLSFLTGIENSEISRYEQGKINLTINTLLKFSEALNIQPKQLFDFDFDIHKYKIKDWGWCVSCNYKDKHWEIFRLIKFM